MFSYNASALDASTGVAPLIAIDSTTDGNIGIEGTAFVDDDALTAGQADAFLLFQFNLIAQADGVTSFSLGSDPDFERNFVGLNFMTLADVTVEGACIAMGADSCRSA